MPFKSTAELPEGVRNALPPRGQRIYRAAANAALKRYPGDDERAARIAWSAVKRVFRKKGDKWVAKSQSASLEALLTDIRRLHEAHWRVQPTTAIQREAVLDVLSQVASAAAEPSLLRDLEETSVPFFDFEQMHYGAMPMGSSHEHDFPGSLDHRIRTVCHAIHEAGEEYLGDYGFVLAVYPDFAVTCSIDEDYYGQDYWKVDYTFDPETMEVTLGDAQSVEVLTVVAPAIGEGMETPDSETLMTASTVQAEGQNFKTDNGQKFSRDAYLIIGDADKPSTWKVRVEETPGNVTVAQLGRAFAALTKGFRGNKVSAPAEQIKAALSKLRGLYRKMDAPWPGEKDQSADAATDQKLLATIVIDPEKVCESIVNAVSNPCVISFAGALNQDPQWHTYPDWLLQGDGPPGGDEELTQTFTAVLEQKDVDPKTGVMKVRGVATVGNVLNAMGEVYPTQVWQDNMPYLQEAIAQGALLGESDHPADQRPSIDRTCIVFDSLQMDGDKVMFQARVLPTEPSGKNLQILLQNGAKIDISSRGRGSRIKGDWVNPSTGERYQDVYVIQRGYRCKAFDAVVNGASPGATITDHEMAQQTDENLAAKTQEEVDVEKLDSLAQQVETLTALVTKMSEMSQQPAAPAAAATPAAGVAALTPAPDAQVQAITTVPDLQAVAALNAIAERQKLYEPILIEQRKQTLLDEARTQHAMPQQWLNSYRRAMEAGEPKTVEELEDVAKRALPLILAQYDKRPRYPGNGHTVQQDAGERPGPQTPRQMIEFLIKDLPDESPFNPFSFTQKDESGNEISAPDWVKTPRRQMRQVLLNIADYSDDHFNGPAALQAYTRLFQGYNPARVKEAWLDQACADGTTSVAAGGAPSSAIFIFPLVRAVYPQLIAPEIASVQPMDRPDGRIFYLNALRIVTGMDVVDQAGTTLSNRQFMDNSSSFSSSYANRAAECDEAVKIQLRLASVNVTAENKALTTVNTIEELQDLRSYHGLDINSELMAAASREIAIEWNLTILNEMAAGATAGTLTFGTVNPTGYTQKEWDEYIGRYVSAASNRIFEKRMGEATHLIAGPRAWEKLAAAFRVGTKMEGANPEMFAGLTLTPFMEGAIMNLKCYKTAFWNGQNTDTILLIRRGADWSDTAYVWAPYIDYISPILTLPDTFTQKQGVMSRAAHKVVVGNAMSKIVISAGTTGTLL